MLDHWQILNYERNPSTSKLSCHILRDSFLICSSLVVSLEVLKCVLSIRAYLDVMCSRVFGPSAYHLVEKLEAAAISKESLNMESCFSQLTLDVVGKAVFNYDFDSLSGDSPLIQAVYTSLKETEQRATELFPLWKVCTLRQQEYLQLNESRFS